MSEMHGGNPAVPTGRGALTVTLTPRELAYCVDLLGHGKTLQQAIDRIQAQRPSLPFTPEAAWRTA